MNEILKWANTLPEIEQETVLAVIAAVTLNVACRGKRSTKELLEVAATMVGSGDKKHG